MKSLTSKFASARGWALLLTLFLGAGLFVVACGDEDVPTPTTPAPTPPAPTPTPPPPEPEPAPEPPAVPVGLRISASGMDFIEWSWNAVEGVSGYDVQYSANEAFTDEDETIARTAEEISYRREGLEAGVSAFLRVRAAAGTGEERVTSDWSTHVTGMTAEPEPEVPAAPAAPANLRLKESGSDFIEWEWDEVPGADGYESQFSADGVSFVALQPHAGVSNTSRTVSNLGAETVGHLRVRSYTGSGTGTDTVRGDWSASDRQMTDEPPPAVPLSTPTGLDATDESDDAIALEWNGVRNAGAYEVGQREPDGSWGDASCGGADNVVEDEECVASGLSEGTDYDFRVRAVPADDDSAHTTSGWSDVEEARTSGTAEPEPTTPTAGGMGNLNVQWTSDSTGIEWTWDRVAGKTYDYVVLGGNDAPRMDSANPCADQTYPNDQSGVAATDAADPTNSPSLLCVRTTNPDNRSENLSSAWGVKPPSDRPTVAGASPDTDSGKATKSLTWGGIDVMGGFSYEINVIADPERDNRVEASLTGVPLQRACSAGQLLESDETDVDLEELETTLTSVKPYTGYLLCLRMLNSAGASDWVSSAAEHYTAPGQAPKPSKNSSRSEDDRDTVSEKIVWNVGTRGNSNVPRGEGTFADHYNLKVITHADKNDVAESDGGDADDYHDDAVTRPKASTCGEDEFDTSPYTSDESPTVGLTSDGFTVTVTSTRPSAPGVKIGVDSQGDDRNAVISNIVSLCIQAKDGNRVGPWNISTAETIEKQREQN